MILKLDAALRTTYLEIKGRGGALFSMMRYAKGKPAEKGCVVSKYSSKLYLPWTWQMVDISSFSTTQPPMDNNSKPRYEKQPRAGDNEDSLDEHQDGPPHKRST